MRIRVLFRFVFAITLLGGASCHLLKAVHTPVAVRNPVPFVLNRIDTACFSRAELDQVRANKDYVTIAFDEMILDSASHCVGLYRFGLADKPAWPSTKGFKCYVLKFKDKVAIAEQTADRVVTLDKFFNEYGKLFTDKQQETIRKEFMYDCVLVQGE
ncbi:MAG: hypothetical protein ACHQRM_00480 [Bacteroidia bacterium]